MYVPPSFFSVLSPNSFTCSLFSQHRIPDTMTDARELHPLGPSIVHTVWLFQGVLAAPAFVLLGAESLRIIYNSYGSESVWDPLKNLFLALFAAMIVFILLIQHKYTDPHPKLATKFELAKAVLATISWLLLLLDAIFRSPWFDPYDRYRTNRIIYSSATVIVLLFVSLKFIINVTKLFFANQIVFSSIRLCSGVLG